jgi:hypothetical protein
VTDLELTDRNGGAVVETTAEKPGIFISDVGMRVCLLAPVWVKLCPER